MGRKKDSVARVVVVGSVNVDLTSYVDSFPVVGETALAKQAHLSLGGKGLNQAVAASRSGADVALIACVGKDEFGHQLLQYVTREKIGSTGIKRTLEKPTGTANILVDSVGENMIAVAPGANRILTSQHVERNASLIQGADVLLLQMEVPVEVNIRAAEIAAEAGTCVILDPSPYQPSSFFDQLLSLTDVLTPNETEAAQICGVPQPSFDRLCDLLESKGILECVLTKGARGCAARLSDQDHVLEGLSVRAVDPTGAGDVFNGYLSKCIGSGMRGREALEHASWAGALSTTVRGAQGSAPYWANVESHIAGGNSAIPN